MEIDSKYLITKFDEEIYSAKSSDNPDKINESITNFFTEMMKRKRDDSYEGGLQLSAVIFKDCYAAKINEENGTAPHLSTHVNLVRYLNGEKEFFTIHGTRRFKLIHNDMAKLLEEGIEIRMICSTDEFTIIINSENDINSEFEYNIIKSFVKCAYEFYKAKYLKNITFHIGLAKNYLEIENWNEMSYSEIEEYLNSEMLQVKHKK